MITQLPQGARIVLVRHGQPHIPLAPSTTHGGFHDYITAYEEAGLDPASIPPRELAELGRELVTVFSSDRPRSHQSARAFAPQAELVSLPLFAEAQLASPRVPLLKMRVPKWAVLSRILWHLGFAPSIENFSTARRRATEAADILIAQAARTGKAALVAHGYFNAMIGWELRQHGFVKRGSHQARYWNTVVYEWPDK